MSREDRSTAKTELRIASKMPARVGCTKPLGKVSPYCTWNMIGNLPRGDDDVEGRSVGVGLGGEVGGVGGDVADRHQRRRVLVRLDPRDVDDDAAQALGLDDAADVGDAGSDEAERGVLEVPGRAVHELVAPELPVVGEDAGRPLHLADHRVDEVQPRLEGDRVAPGGVVGVAVDAVVLPRR